MKRKITLTVLIITCIILIYPLTANANISDMSLTIEESDEAQELWSSLKVKQVENIFLDPAISFDVNESGFVLVLTNNECIVVLDNNNTQVSCFSFESYASCFVKWYNQDILLFLNRGGIIVQMDIYGNLISVMRVNEDDWDTAKIWRELQKSKSVVIEDSEYYMKNNSKIYSLVTSSYSSIEKCDANGNVSVVYDASEQFNALGVLFIMVSIFIIGVLIYMVYKFVKSEKNPTIKEWDPTIVALSEWLAEKGKSKTKDNSVSEKSGDGSMIDN